MQGIAIGSITAVGIVGTLVVIGIILKITGVASALGDIAMFMGVLIGIALGLFGVFSVVKRVF
jgi:hypothetical protein